MKKAEIKKFKRFQEISFVVIITTLLTLFFSSAKAGIVEDVIKEQKLDVKKAEDRCKLSDQLTMMVNNFDERVVNGRDYTEYEICDGDKYEVINGKVSAGSQGTYKHLAQCYLHDSIMFRIFRYSDIKIATVSRGFDDAYLVPIKIIFFSPDNKKIEAHQVNTNSFANGSLIKLSSKPIHKMDYYRVKNCDFKAY